MPRFAKHRWRWCAVTAATILTACSPEPTRVTDGPGAQFARGGPTSSVTVTAATPGYGKRGERLSVRITGSGFNSSATATWEHGGVVDPNVAVLGTTYVSSTEVIADVQIGSAADLEFYDVGVTITLVGGGRKKGVGIEMFEVTSAALLPTLSGSGNNSLAWGLNDAGQVVGRSNTNAFFWDAATGIDALGPGEAIDVTQDGLTVVGMNNSGTPRDAMVWAGGHGAWVAAKLSTACLANVEWSMARSIARDGSLIGGRISTVDAQYPVVWDSPTSSCRVLSIPAGFDGGRVADVNALGMATGVVHLGSKTSTMRAIVWDAAGTPTVLAPVSGDTFSQAFAIAPNGKIVAGMSGDRSAYWVQTPSGWSAGIPLAQKCGNSGQSWARGVNDLGVIVGNGCDGGRWWRIENGVLAETALMPGFGPTSHPVPEAITNNSVSGQAWAAGGGAGSTFWRIP